MIATDFNVAIDNSGVHSTLRPEIIVVTIIIFYICYNFPCFLDLPIDLLLRGEFHQTGIPAIIGVTQNEGGYFVIPIKGIYTIQCIFNDLFHITVISFVLVNQHKNSSNPILFLSVNGSHSTES